MSLNGLYLEDEVVDKIMGKHGRTMGDLTAAKTTIDTLTMQISERTNANQKTLVSLKIFF